MNEEMKSAEQVEGAALKGDVRHISAGEVMVLSDTAQTIEAHTVTVKQGAVGKIRAESA